MVSLEPYLRAFEALPDAARTTARRSALDTFLALGFPGTGEEEWKYTDLAPLTALPPEALAPGAQAPLTLPETYADGLDALNAAFAAGGLEQSLDGVTAEPIVAAADGHQRHRLHLKRGAEATLVLDVSGASLFQTVFSDITLDDGARLHVLRIADPGTDAHRLTRTHITLGRDAQLDMVCVDLGGRLVRHDLTIDLAAPGAEARLHGLYAPIGQSHVDNHTRIEHRAPHCSSREYFRGIARDKARAIFNGMIRVHQGAQKTDSEQRVANLILSKGAEINAKPELEIYADDVKCAHGATFGQLDENALFYLRSRGLPREAARALLIWTFANEILQHIANPMWKERVTQRLLKQFPEAAIVENTDSPLPPGEGQGVREHA